MNISIRKFAKTDIPKKVEWINNPKNNKYLHYDLPLEIGKTEKWFEHSSVDSSRYDGVIVVDGVECGLIGLLNIDCNSKRAELYTLIGEEGYKGKGIASRAIEHILKCSFETVGLQCVYSLIEVDNIASLKMVEKTGFKKKKLLKNNAYREGQYRDRFLYEIESEEYLDHEKNTLCNHSEK